MWTFRTKSHSFVSDSKLHKQQAISANSNSVAQTGEIPKSEQQNSGLELHFPTNTTSTSTTRTHFTPTVTMSCTPVLSRTHYSSFTRADLGLYPKPVLAMLPKSEVRGLPHAELCARARVPQVNGEDSLNAHWLETKHAFHSHQDGSRLLTCRSGGQNSELRELHWRHMQEKRAQVHPQTAHQFQAFVAWPLGRNISCEGHSREP